MPGFREAAMSGLASMAPAAIPPDNALANVMMSGSTSVCWKANHLPVRPIPV